jgi:hypothetical protein
VVLDCSGHDPPYERFLPSTHRTVPGDDLDRFTGLQDADNDGWKKGLRDAGIGGEDTDGGG